MQQNATPTVTETPVVSTVVTTPATQTQVVDNYDNVSVRPERVTLVNGSGLRAYNVVVGSFSVLANAEGLQQRLNKAGYQAQIAKNEERNKSYVFGAARPNAKLARLEYHQIAVSSGGYHLLDINLHTGRHHQIRCQLANIGCPIKGDLKYGAERSNPDGSITLHAHTVIFEHPVTHKQITITAPNHEIEKMFNIS